MRWSDELTLVSVESPDESDEHGFPLLQVETKTTVYANKKSVGFNEYFKAAQMGYTEQIKFDVFTEEYTGQQYAEYEGKRYKVLRTYADPKTEGEYTELTLSDLSEK